MSNLAPSPTGHLHGATLESIGRNIVTGALPTGATLNVEEVGQQLGASRAVLREVFRVLETKGLITARPKVGTRVAPPSMWNYLDPHVIRWRTEGPARATQLTELFAMRLAVEPVAARLASLQVDPALIESLTQNILDMESAYQRRDLHSFAEADVAFHLAIIEASKNQMFRALRGVIESAVRTRETLYFPLDEPMLRGLEMHKELVREIGIQDPAIERTTRGLIVDAQMETEQLLGQWDNDDPKARLTTL